MSDHAKEDLLLLHPLVFSVVKNDLCGTAAWTDLRIWSPCMFTEVALTVWKENKGSDFVPVIASFISSFWYQDLPTNTECRVLGVCFLGFIFRPFLLIIFNISKNNKHTKRVLNL